MLTPAFELRQDSVFLTIIIKARYAKVSETEIFVDGTDFKFYSKPYFLRLNLPGKLLEDGREKASYDVESGSFTVKIAKATEGELFEGLDLLTRLLAPAGLTCAKEPSIEVLDGDITDSGDPGGQEKAEEEEDEQEFDWRVAQQPFSGSEDNGECHVSGVRYGFANRRSGVFKRLREEICGVVDIQDADTISFPELKRAKMMAEKDKFDDSHYLADLYQDDAIKPILQFKPSWVRNYKQLREKQIQGGDLASKEEATVDVQFSDEEKELMLRLPRKEFLLSNVEERGALLGVADILFAYAYNNRTNEGENSVESAWTLCKLSSTLSCLDWFRTPRELVVACCRRALCFPLYRNWALCQKVIEDVRMILRLGRGQILKCFFEIHKLLSSDEPRYILNDLYISDYCVWLQSVPVDTLSALEHEIGQVQLEKKDVGLDLDDLEDAAAMTIQDEEGAGPTQHEGGQGELYQTGYPDVIQRSQPSPDIVTTHIIRGAQIAHGDMEDHEDEEEEEDSSSDSDDDDGDEDGGENKSAEADDAKENIHVKGVPDSGVGAHPFASASKGCSTLESDFVSKVTLAMDSGDDQLHNQKMPSLLGNSDRGIIRAGRDEEAVNVTDWEGDKCEGGNVSRTQDVGNKEEDKDEEVLDTMKDMLDHLSLTSSSSLLFDRTEEKEDGRERDSLSFQEWSKSQPTKLVEIFESK